MEFFLFLYLEKKKRKRFPLKLPDQHCGPGFTQLVKGIQEKVSYRLTRSEGVAGSFLSGGMSSSVKDDHIQL